MALIKNVFCILAAVFLFSLAACDLDGGDGGKTKPVDPWANEDPNDCGGNNYSYSDLVGSWDYTATGGIVGLIQWDKTGKMFIWISPSCDAWGGANRISTDLVNTVTCGGLVSVIGPSVCAADPAAPVGNTRFKLKFDPVNPRKLSGIYYIDYPNDRRAIYLYKQN